jgi:hypothetical protein
LDSFCFACFAAFSFKRAAIPLIPHASKKKYFVLKPFISSNDSLMHSNLSSWCAADTEGGSMGVLSNETQ